MAGTSEFLKAYKQKQAGVSSDVIAKQITEQRATTPLTPAKINFGDVSQKSSFSGTKTPGATLSTGQTIAPTQAKPLDRSLSVYGQQAINTERTTPGTLTRRNDQIASNLFSQGQTSQDQVANYLRGQAGFTNATAQDQTNTIRAITERLAGMKPQQPAQPIEPIQPIAPQQTIQQQAEGVAQGYLDQDLSVLRKEKGTDSFVKRMDDMLEQTGQTTLTSEQIQQIGNQIGLTPEDAQKTNDARQRQRDVTTRSAVRGMEDMTTQRERNLTDAEIQHTRTQEAINNQIGDVQREMERSIGQGEKMGALTGQGRSSGYTAGLDNIKSDAQRVMDRLRTQAQQDTDDTLKYKTRIGQDYEQNMSRVKTDMSDNLRELRMATSGQVQTAVEKYGTSSDLLSSQLDKIQEEFGARGQQAFAQYLQNVKSITDTAYSETEKIQELQMKQQQIEQVQVNNLLANNGLALSGMTDGDLKGMVTNGALSLNNYNLMKGNMLGLASSSLSQLGQPSSQDIKQLQTLIDSGTMTPQQAIQTVAGQNPTRFDPLKAKNFDDLMKQQQMQLQVANFKQGQQEFAQTQNLREQQFGLDKQMSQIKIQELETEMEDKQLATRTQRKEAYSDVYSQTSGGTEGISVVATTVPDGIKGGQCGAFVNDIFKSAGATQHMGNLLSEKIALVNSDKPVVGSAFVQSIGGKNKAYGHTGIVTAVNGDYITVKDSNRSDSNDEKTRTRTININDPSLQGYVVPNATKKATTQTSKTEVANSPEQLAFAPSYASYFEGEQVPVTIMKDMGGPEVFARKAKEYYIPTKNRELAQYGYKIADEGKFISSNQDKEKRKVIAQGFAEAEEMKRNVNEILGILKTSGTEATDFTESGARLSQLETNLKMILKGDNGYALGVLAGPDMEVLEGMVKPTVGGKAIASSNSTVIKAYEDMAKQFNAKFDTRLKQLGVEKDTSTQQTNTTPQNTNSILPQQKQSAGGYDTILAYLSSLQSNERIYDTSTTNF